MTSRLSPAQSALLEVGILFLPAIPAYLWLWPNVEGSGGTLANILVYLYVLAGTLFIGLRRWKGSELGLNLRGIPISLAYGGVFFLSRLLVLLGVQWPGTRPAFTFLESLGQVAFYIGMVGLVEELLHRGLIYRAIQEWRGDTWAVWGSSIAFMLWHIFGHGPVIGVTMFFFGLIFGMIRRYSGGITGLILVHGLIDLETVFLVSESNQEIVNSRVAFAHPGLVFAGAVLLVALPLFMWLAHPRIFRPISV
jgi:membrane protease YdiL (CAAX protease family)